MKAPPPDIPAFDHFLLYFSFACAPVPLTAPTQGTALRPPGSRASRLPNNPSPGLPLWSSIPLTPTMPLSLLSPTSFLSLLAPALLLPAHLLPCGVRWRGPRAAKLDGLAGHAKLQALEERQVSEAEESVKQRHKGYAKWPMNEKCPLVREKHHVFSATVGPVGSGTQKLLVYIFCDGTKGVSLLSLHGVSNEGTGVGPWVCGGVPEDHQGAASDPLEAADVHAMPRGQEGRQHTHCLRKNLGLESKGGEGTPQEKMGPGHKLRDRGRSSMEMHEGGLQTRKGCPSEGRESDASLTLGKAEPV